MALKPDVMSIVVLKIIRIYLCGSCHQGQGSSLHLSSVGHGPSHMMILLLILGSRAIGHSLGHS